MSRAVRVHITGKVQGVGFRAWTERSARSRGLDGWVRNRRDGSVEAVVSGSEAAVEEMLAAFHRGPSSGRVDEVSHAAVEMPEKGFRVLPTA
jgi:acylphosphatase